MKEFSCQQIIFMFGKGRRTKRYRETNLFKASVFFATFSEIFLHIRELGGITLNLLKMART